MPGFGVAGWSYSNSLAATVRIWYPEGPQYPAEK